jgi:hypothetical protein
VSVRILLMLAVALVACDPGPTPEMRARSVDETRTIRYDNSQYNSSPPSAPPDTVTSSRKSEKTEKH